MKLTTALIFCCALTAFSQYENKGGNEQMERFPWPDNTQCAVSLTFDDARLSQIEKGMPLLDKYNIKATFYISPDNCLHYLDEWKKAAASGHEIGNHTFTHPCTGNYAFSRNNALENYTPERMASDIDKANEFIEEHFGQPAASFAYPCGQKFVGRGEKCRSYVPLVANRFKAGRSWLDEDSNDPWFCDTSRLLAMEADGKSFQQLKELILAARQEGRWIIFAGHEMQESGAQTTLLASLDSLCQFMKDPANGIWVDTVEHIATYVENNR